MTHTHDLAVFFCGAAFGAVGILLCLAYIALRAAFSRPPAELPVDDEAERAVREMLKREAQLDRLARVDGVLRWLTPIERVAEREARWM